MTEEVKVTVNVDGLDDLMAAIDDVNEKILDLRFAVGRLMNMQVHKNIQPPIGSDG